MPDLKHNYIEEHLDDPDLVARFPNFKARRNECERQFIAGKLRPSNTTKSAPAEEGTTDSEDAAAPAGQPEPGPDGEGIEDLADALGAIADAPDGDVVVEGNK